MTYNTYRFDDVDYDWNGGSILMNKVGVTPGVKAGYNWQFGSAVLGLEADYSDNIGASKKECLAVGT